MPSLKNNGDWHADKRVAYFLAVIITVAWAISFLVNIVVREYNPPASVHALMMLVAGSVFGEGLLKSRMNGKNGNGANGASR